jgi:hypothetical protein
MFNAKLPPEAYDAIDDVVAALRATNREVARPK